MDTRGGIIPRSLLQVAGAPLHPCSFQGSVLLLIDLQLEYIQGALRLPAADAAVQEAERLLQAARRSGTPVFHIAHHAPPGAPIFDPDGPEVAIAPVLTPQEGEDVVRKSMPNAFAKTDLDERIRATGRKELIVAGFMTHMCVSATVRAALDLGYRSTVVAAAAASRDLPDPLGGVVPAETVHRAALAALGDRFAIIVKRTEDLAA